MRKHRLAAFLAMFAAALTLVLGAVPAQALTGNETAKITLSSDSDAKMTGYKIIDYRFEDGAPVGSGFYWNDDFAAEVKNVNSSWIDDKNDNAVTEHMPTPKPVNWKSFTERSPRTQRLRPSCLSMMRP